MTTAGYSGTLLPKKLGIKDGSTVATISAPNHFADLLVPLPPGVRIRSNVRAKGPFDVLAEFVALRDGLWLVMRARRRSVQELEGLLERLDANR
jgi:hypothetical protein